MNNVVIKFTFVKYIGKLLIDNDNICANPCIVKIIAPLLMLNFNISGKIKNALVLICVAIFTSKKFTALDKITATRTHMFSFTVNAFLPAHAQQYSQYVINAVIPQQI